MSNSEDDDIDEVFDKLEELQDDDEVGDTEPDEDEPDGAGGGDDGGGMGALERMRMMGGDPSDLPLTYDDAAADLDPEDRMDIEEVRESFREGDDDDDNDDDETEMATEEKGSSAGQLATIGEVGPVEVKINPIVVDTVKKSEQPGEGEEPGRVEEYIASRPGGLEVHYSAEDEDVVHGAVAEAMHPTEDQLRENPDKTITKDSLMWFTYPSANDNWDYCNTFRLAREGDAKFLNERGPWTARRFNVQDLIDTLAQQTYSDPRGVVVATQVAPFK
jgi:hypothetical protein